MAEEPELPYQESDRALRSLFTTGKYSDLVITCGDRKFNVHKAILCARSPFFAKACEPARFKEGVENSITLEAISSDEDGEDFELDDPEAIHWMIRFLYFHDYDFEAVEGSEKSNEKSEHSVHPRRLSMHAKLYALGEKYEIPTLKTTAARKFAADAKASIPDTDDLAHAVRVVHQSTVESDVGLRKVLMTALALHARKIAPSPAIQKVIVETPGLGFALWAHAVGMPAGPTCLACHEPVVKDCPGCPKEYRTVSFVTCKCQSISHCAAHLVKKA